MKFLDLCSGLGGASEAFLQNGWSVRRIDNNSILANVPFTSIMSLADLRIKLENHNGDYDVDVVWFSPPCLEFSNGYNSPKSKHVREHGIDSYEPDMSILMEGLEIIKILKPKYWIVENVAGATRYFNSVLGAPRQILGAFVLWGNFPYIHLDPGELPLKKSKDVHSGNPLRSNLLAKIPYRLSEELLKSITVQKRLDIF